MATQLSKANILFENTRSVFTNWIEYWPYRDMNPIVYVKIKKREFYFILYLFYIFLFYLQAKWLVIR